MEHPKLDFACSFTATGNCTLDEGLRRDVAWRIAHENDRYICDPHHSQQKPKPKRGLLLFIRHGGVGFYLGALRFKPCRGATRRQTWFVARSRIGGQVQRSIHSSVDTFRVAHGMACLHDQIVEGRLRLRAG